MSCPHPYVGRQLLDIVTSGMYSDPMMVLREYVQNAADAIDAASSMDLLRPDEGRIKVVLDPASRNIVVEDNGTGLSYSKAGRLLCGLGVSSKDSGENRGFRGIGRFGGLGYCKGICFETRSGGDERVTIINWNARKLSQYSSRQGHLDMREAFQAAGDIRTRAASASTPVHFFRVTMIGVTQFHRDPLMDMRNVRRYLGQVAPVPFDENIFPYGKEIQKHLGGFPGFRHYHLTVNNAEIHRPHSTKFNISGETYDLVRDVELFDFIDREGKILAKGWYAKTSFLASLPVSVEMRGIRVCQGNLEIGGPRFLAQSFKERRFATWHIGEIHLSHSIRPNARRDDFEQSPEYETFLEHALALGQHLSKLCRRSSRERTARSTFERKLSEIIDSMESGIYLDTDHQEESLSKIAQQIDTLESSARQYSWPNTAALLRNARRKLGLLKSNSLCLHNQVDGRRLRRSTTKELLEDVCRRVIHERDNGGSFDALLEGIVQPYLKT